MSGPDRSIAPGLLLHIFKSSGAAIKYVCGEGTIMKSKSSQVSAFEQGQKAGSDSTGPVVPNPFDEGSAQHNNFEVGRRFGATNVDANDRRRKDVNLLVPDADESIPPIESAR